MTALGIAPGALRSGGRSGPTAARDPLPVVFDLPEGAAALACRNFLSNRRGVGSILGDTNMNPGKSFVFSSFLTKSVPIQEGQHAAEAPIYQLGVKLPLNQPARQVVLELNKPAAQGFEAVPLHQSRIHCPVSPVWGLVCL